MGDMGDYFRDLKAYKKDERDKRFQKNMQALINSGIDFDHDPAKNSTVVLIRAEEVSVDFYPGTGRWKDNLQSQKMFRGGAAAMLHVIGLPATAEPQACPKCGSDELSYERLSPGFPKGEWVCMDACGWDAPAR